MSATVQMSVMELLERAVVARTRVEQARTVEREATVAFMDEARSGFWSWERIGQGLGISGVAARTYHTRNRRKVRSV